MYVFRTICIVIAVMGTSLAFAAESDEFYVRTQYGNDTIPPTVPTNLVATPVALSQIDLTWSSSTDNFLLSGYRVFRDFNLTGTGTTDFQQIATTSATSYSDVGLTASTTYSYYVTAFDSSGNVSASSTVAATTTLASSTPPEEEEATTTDSGAVYGSRSNSLSIISLEIIPDTTSVRIRYTTRGYVRGVIRWGESVAYELGSLSERSFSRVHETTITGLWPDTTYRFVIEGEGSNGRFETLTRDTFTTLPPDDIFPPANVANLRAYQSGEDIVLSWSNPSDRDFSHVRVLRNSTFYPNDPVDGWLIHEGDDEGVIDRGAAVPGVRQYYTVFSYDALGNISSGAVVSILISDGSGSGQTDTEDPPPPEGEEEAPPPEIDFTFDDVVFMQEGIVLEKGQNSVRVDGSKQLTVSIPYDEMPRHLKTIVLELENEETGESLGSYLLRVDANFVYYTTTLAPFREAGRFPITLSIFDYETSELARVSGNIISVITTMVDDEETGGGFVAYILDLLNDALRSLWFWIIIILIIMYLIFMWRRKKDKSDSIYVS